MAGPLVDPRREPETHPRHRPGAGLLNRHVLPAFRNVPLAELTHADVERWASQLTSSGLAAATVRQAHRVLSLVLALAVRMAGSRATRPTG